jgi:histidinol-phosphate aminotransferase
VTTPTRPAATPRADLRDLDGYHSPQVDVDVRLNTNESPFAPPPAFVDALADALRATPLHRYPDRSAVALREALGAACGQPPTRVFCANGSNEVLQTLLLTYGGAGRRALLFEPTYALHAHIARITATEVVAGERRDDFAVDPGTAADAVRRSRPGVVLLCSPNNPTGTVDPPELVDHLAGAAEEVGALLVVDEAYGEFAPSSAIDRVADDRPVVVVRTYSKVWALAGVRLGFAVAPATVVDELDKVGLPYRLSTPTQLAGRLALRFADEMRDRVSTLVRERERLIGRLARLEGITVHPSGANFVLFRVHGDGHALWERLLARGVLVRDFSRWPRVEECLRVTIGTRDENDRFLAALGEAIPEVVA